MLCVLSVNDVLASAQIIALPSNIKTQSLSSSISADDKAQITKVPMSGKRVVQVIPEYEGDSAEVLPKHAVSNAASNRLISPVKKVQKPVLKKLEDAPKNVVKASADDANATTEPLNQLVSSDVLAADNDTQAGYLKLKIEPFLLESPRTPGEGRLGQPSIEVLPEHAVSKAAPSTLISPVKKVQKSVSKKLEDVPKNTVKASTIGASTALSIPSGRQSPSDNDAKNIKYNTQLQKAVAAIERNDNALAFDVFSKLYKNMVANHDIGSILLFGYVARNVGNEEASLKAFKMVVELGEEDDFYIHYLDALMYFKRLEQADVVLRKLADTDLREKYLAKVTYWRALEAYKAGNNAETEKLLMPMYASLDGSQLIILGWAQFQLEAFDRASSSFIAAYKLLPAENSAQGIIFSLSKLGRYSTIADVANATTGPLNQLVSPDVLADIAKGKTDFTVDSEGRLSSVEAFDSASGSADKQLPSEGSARGRAQRIIFGLD